ncbi:MAG: DMT family transporter [Anaerovoracaceae bacterium]
MHKEYNIRPYLAGMIFATLIGFSFYAIKLCVTSGTAIQILTYRFNFAFLAVIIILICNKNKKIEMYAHKLPLLVIGATYIGFMLLQTIGLVIATSIECSIIFATIPIMVQVIASFYLNEKTTKAQNFFAILTVFALLVMIIKGATGIEVNIFGFIILIISALSMAVNNVLMRKYRGVFRPFEMSSMTVIIGFIVFNVITIILGIINNNIGEYFKPIKDPTFLFATIYLGVFCILITNTIAGYMYSKLKAVQSSIFGNLSTAISISLGVIMLNEPFYTYQIICTIMVLVGVIGINLKKTNIN